MPERIRFTDSIPPAKRAIEAALVPLADAGYAVTVVAPDEEVDKHLGWRVSLDAPGLHTSLRVPTDADPVAWAAAVARAPRRSS
jgi:hypothetical protein